MNDSYLVVLETKDTVDLLGVDKAVNLAAVRAVNRTIERARVMAAREMRQQVNFPARYLTGNEARLRIAQRANGTNLEAVLRGRRRATSLARFSRDTSPQAVRRRGGVNVQVKPGVAKFMRGAFLVRLRAGNTLTDTQFNLGVAIRLKPGERVRNKTQMSQLDHNVYLLYGPSVDQVFNTVREDISPETRDFLASEFQRLLDLRGV